MRSRDAVRCSALLLGWVCTLLSAPAFGQSVPALFDSFESDPAWGMFEEVVGNSPCYGSGIGEVSRQAGLAYDGSSSLRVWANRALTTRSSHVIAQKRFSPTGQPGRWRMEVSCYLPPESAGRSQTGPEISMQNTRREPAGFRTSTAGLQYRASPWAEPRGNWAIWCEQSDGVAGWQTFTVEPLATGQWYRITLEADFDASCYRWVAIEGGGTSRWYWLQGVRIAHEAKFAEEAFWLTLEAENLWNNCGTAGAFDCWVAYDDVTLRQEP